MFNLLKLLSDWLSDLDAIFPPQVGVVSVELSCMLLTDDRGLFTEFVVKMEVGPLRTNSVTPTRAVGLLLFALNRVYLQTECTRRRSLVMKLNEVYEACTPPSRMPFDLIG